MQPVLAALGKELDDRVSLVQTDLDPLKPLSEQEIAADFGIDGHPYTAVLDGHGNLVSSWYGRVDRSTIVEALRTAGLRQ